MTAVASEVQRECTPAEGAVWRDRFTTGYVHGRRDVLSRRLRGDALCVIPADVPGETGARYVARNLDAAYRIGYTRAFYFYRDTSR
jgi:hypothetical protein